MRALAKTSDSLVEELVKILDETKSHETFNVTLAVLRKLGKQAKPAIPAILHNANRLDLFTGAQTGDSKGKQAVTVVQEAIDAILAKTEPSAPAIPCSSISSGMSGFSR